MTAVRVVVVEDSPVQRAHLVDVLQAERDITVIGQAGDPAEAVDLVHRLRPDVVTMDLGLPGDGGLGAIEQIMADLPTPILVLSARVTGAGSAAAVESLLAGAVETLPKPERWDAEAERQVRCRVRLLQPGHGGRPSAGPAPAAGSRPVPRPAGGHRRLDRRTGGAGRDPAPPGRAGRARPGRPAPAPAAGRRLRQLDAAGVRPARGGGRRRRPPAAGDRVHRPGRRPPPARSRPWPVQPAGGAAASGLPDWQVVATDLSATAVARARTGRYSAAELAGLPPAHRHWLRPAGDLWEIDPALRRRVRVERANLTAQFPVEPGRCQVVFCRNVLIYLSRPVAASFLDRLATWLAPGGLAFLGYAEAALAPTPRLRVQRVGAAYALQVGPGEGPGRQEGLGREGPGPRRVELAGVLRGELGRP